MKDDAKPIPSGRLTFICKIDGEWWIIRPDQPERLVEKVFAKSDRYGVTNHTNRDGNRKTRNRQNST